MFKKTISVVMSIFLGLVCLLPSSSVGALGSCSNPEEDSVVWYMGGSSTRVGTLEPGQVYYGEIEACNSDTKTRKVDMETAPYSINQVDYENVDFITENNWNKLSHWITFPEGNVYTLEPGQTVFLKFRIQVPRDGTAIAGTQSASIMLKDTFRGESEESLGVHAEKRYLWLVTADIHGADLNYNGKIKEWRADGPLIFTNTNGVNTYSLVENSGNASFVTKYKLTITDSFRNGALAYEAEVEKEILPESKRANEFKWNEAPAIGWFKIKEEITVLGNTETFEKTVFIIPLWIIIIFAIILFLLIWAIYLRVKQHREKNKKLK